MGIKLAEVEWLETTMAARMQRREREFGLLQLSVGADFTLDHEPTDIRMHPLVHFVEFSKKGRKYCIILAF